MFFLLYFISYRDKFRNADIFNFMLKCVARVLKTFGFKQVRENCAIIIEFWRDADEEFNKLGVWEFFIETRDSSQIQKGK
jgi:hypothetical protein